MLRDMLSQVGVTFEAHYAINVFLCKNMESVSIIYIDGQFSERGHVLKRAS